jgi:hypothetical protein
MPDGPDRTADRRMSAAVNSMLVLVLALIPLSGSVDTTAIDHREQRPWGCRTCLIPQPPASVEPVDEDL